MLSLFAYFDYASYFLYWFSDYFSFWYCFLFIISDYFNDFIFFSSDLRFSVFLHFRLMSRRLFLSFSSAKFFLIFAFWLFFFLHFPRMISCCLFWAGWCISFSIASIDYFDEGRFVFSRWFSGFLRRMPCRFFVVSIFRWLIFFFADYGCRRCTLIFSWFVFSMLIIFSIISLFPTFRYFLLQAFFRFLFSFVKDIFFCRWFFSFFDFIFFFFFAFIFFSLSAALASFIFIVLRKYLFVDYFDYYYYFSIIFFISTFLHFFSRRFDYFLHFCILFLSWFLRCFHLFHFHYFLLESRHYWLFFITLFCWFLLSLCRCFIFISFSFDVQHYFRFSLLSFILFHFLFILLPAIFAITFIIFIILHYAVIISLFLVEWWDAY